MLLTIIIGGLRVYRGSLGVVAPPELPTGASLETLSVFLLLHAFANGTTALTGIEWVGTFFIFVLAGVQIICFSWVFGAKRGLEEAHRGASIRIPPFYRFVIQYVAPTYLLVVFVAFCYANLGQWIRDVASSPLRQGAIALVAAVLVFLLVCIRVGERRWRAAGLDLDGREPLSVETGIER